MMSNVLPRFYGSQCILIIIISIVQLLCTFIIFLHVSAPPLSFYNRTVYLGTTVRFPCPTKLEEDVIWRRWKTMKWYPDYVYFHGSMFDGVDPRMTVDQNSSYALVIANVTADDAAVYGCDEDNGFGNRHFFVLTVAGELRLIISILSFEPLRAFSVVI